MPKFASTLPDMSAVMKDSPHKAVLEELLTKTRLRATALVRETMPQKIVHLQQLLDSENDPESLLWVGHVDQGDYVHPRLLQPDQVAEAGAAVTMGGLANGENGKSNGDGHVTDGLKELKLGDKGASVDGRQILMPGQVVRASADVEGEDADETAQTNGTVHADGTVERGVRVGPHWFEVVPQNAIHNKLMDLVIREHEELQMTCMALKAWLELEIPVIEDGNSFGADVQEHLIDEVDRLKKTSYSCTNGMRSHNIDRMKHATEWVKYPNVMDFPAAITASDRCDHFLVRMYLRQALIAYSGLLTKLERNWAKVINPKGSGGSSGEAMY